MKLDCEMKEEQLFFSCVLLYFVSALFVSAWRQEVLSQVKIGTKAR